LKDAIESGMDIYRGKVTINATVKCPEYWQGFKIGDKVLCDVKIASLVYNDCLLEMGQWETENNILGTIIDTTKRMRFIVELDDPIETEKISGFCGNEIKAVRRWPKELKKP